MPTLRINKINENEIHFLTINIIEWINIITKPEYFNAIIDSLKFCQHKKGLLLYEYVIMTNHVHLIASAKESYLLSEIIRDFKRHTGKMIYGNLQDDNRKYIKTLIANNFKNRKDAALHIWQRENYPVVITTEKFYLQKTDYIYFNPVKAGYVDKPEDWLYSSARNRILKDNTVLKVENLE